MSAASGLNRISINVPGSSGTALADRDAMITQMKTAYPGTWNFYHYGDLASGNENWLYVAVGLSISTQGVATVCTVTCGGVGLPPSGSNLVAMNDPGFGSTFTWTAVGAPFGLSASSPGGGGVSPPAGNNNYYVWRIAGNSSTAVADFTAAVTAVNSGVPGNTVRQGFKYVDSVSGAWQVWWIAYGAGSSEFAATASTILANNNILYMVTCAGTPHPPTGSPQPAVSMPAFTQTFTTLSAPLSFGPQR